MKSSFLPLLPQLADPRIRRWGPALLTALTAQLLIVLVLLASWPETRRPRRAVGADDTPLLLRWSRPAPAANPAAALNTIPLQGLLALPPPPPASLGNGAVPPEAAGLPAVRRPSEPPSVEPSRLPRQPGEAFLLARQVASGGPSAEASDALVAVQRRQWWLYPGQESGLLALWAAGNEQPLPAALGPLPLGVQVRSLAAAAAEPLALSELHGRSIRHGNELWLLWRQGPSLWILRGALANPAP